MLITAKTISAPSSKMKSRVHILDISHLVYYYYYGSIWQVTSCFTSLYQQIWHVESLIGNVVENVYIFSDGMSSQFRARFLFHFLIKIQLEKNITWHYNERGHGRGPMHGNEGTVKNLVFKKVKIWSQYNRYTLTVCPICQRNLWIHYFIICESPSLLEDPKDVHPLMPGGNKKVTHT